MTEFALWAPRVRAVELLVGGLAPVRLDRDADGWHRGTAPAAHGDTYRFRLDDGQTVPDPRSRWQPSGVDGPSALFDVASHPWADAAWRGPGPLSAAVLYEMHVGTFTADGTFDSAMDKLDHLVHLGVTAVELMPVAEASGSRGWGYDGVLLYAVHNAYGGPDALCRFVDACHERGLGVVLDVVYNHFGPAGNHVPQLGPYMTDRYRTPWGDAVNLDDAGSDEVRAFFIANALQWLRDFHIDGLRLDAVHALFDQSAVHFLEELTAAVRALEAETGRTKWVIAESDLNDPRLLRSPDAGGYGIDAQWSDDFHHALHVLATGERDGYYADFDAPADVARALQAGFVHTGDRVASRGRRHGRPLGDVPGWRLVGYAQNHDQVGNRAAGERLATLSGVERAKAVAALVLTAPFVPMLFQGEEWGSTTPFQYFTDHADAELGEAVRAGRRGEFAAFGWDPEDVPDPQDEATFLRSKLRWADLGDEVHGGTFEWYRALIGLRRRTPALLDGDLGAVQVETGDGTVLVRRGPVLVAVNVGPGPWSIAIGPSAHLALASAAGVSTGAGVVLLPPETCAVVLDR